jgi:hypothetical protein
VLKTVLALVSLLLMASMGGGFLLLPLLVPMHVWAARRSGRVGRVLWSVLPAAAAGMVTWAATYVTLGEAQPWIWLAPVAAAAAAGVVVHRSAALAPAHVLA